MAIERIYKIPLLDVAVNAAADLFIIEATSGMAFTLHEIKLSQRSQTNVMFAKIGFQRLSGAYEIGSGGTSVTPQPLHGGGAAATVTGLVNNTVRNTGGTQIIFDADDYNYVNGFFYQPAEDDRPLFSPSTAFVLTIDSVPANAVMSGSVTIGELY